MKTLQPLIRIAAVAGLTVILAAAMPVRADPSGRVTTTSVWVDTSHWETRVIGHSDPFWINAYEPPGTGPHDHSGNHQAFCPSPGSLSPGEDPGRCHGNYHEGGDITETVWVSSGYWSTTTVSLSPAAVSGSVSCAYGANGWCVSPATLTITGSEPVAGYSISSIQGSRSGAPFTCSGAVCTQTVADTAGASFTYQAFSTFGDSSYAGSASIKVDTLAPSTSPSLCGATGLNGWHVGPVTISLAPTDASSGVAGSTLNGSAYAAPTTFTAQGATTITYRSTDNAGNAESLQTQSFQIDSVAPSSSASAVGAAGANGWYTSPVTFSLSGSDATSGLDRIMLNGSPYSGPLTLSDGVNTLLFYAVDNAGNQQAAQSVTIQVDATAPVTTPVITGTSGLNGWLTSPSITFAPTAFDATSGVSAIEASLDGGSWADASGGVAVTGEGAHTIQYRSRDAAGNQEAAQSVSVQIDSVVPSSRFTSHTSGQYVAGVVNLSGATTDATSGVASVSFSEGGANWAPLIGAGSWSQTWDTTALPDGAYTLYARGTDAAGNAEHTAAVTLNVDNTVPQVSIVLDCSAPGANGWCRAPVVAQISASDSGSGIAALTYSYGGSTQTVAGGSASFVDGDGGARDVSLYAVDALGHRSPTQSATIRIDGAPPAIQFNGGDRSTLNVSVSDSESGVARWTLQVFTANGQTVFWQESLSAFSSALAWGAPALPGGTYTAQMFAGDEAGNESGAQFSLTLPALPAPTPAPVSIVEQVFTFFTLPTPTTAVAATAAPSPTPMPMPTPMPTPAPVAVSALPPSSPPEQPMKRVDGLVFRDLNANGRRDTGEPGIASILVEIVTVGENVKRVIATGGDGAYSATLLPGKRYLLRCIPPQGVLLTTPAMAFILESDAGGNVVFGVNWSILPASLAMIALLLLLVWMTSAALDRRPGAIRALANEVKIVATFRLRQRVFELRQNDLQL